MGKTVIKSKTFWVNLLFVVFTIIAFATDKEVSETELMAWIMVALPLVNIILRLITKEEIVWE